MTLSSKPQTRRVFSVLSARSLAYAVHGLQSLLLNSIEPLRIVLITDGPRDVLELRDAVNHLKCPREHEVSVVDNAELADVEASLFRSLPALRAFRHGHPCWRKITDPVLLSSPGDELIILDPDIYFPNRFRFEDTPPDGLLLMWQKPNCLVPPEVVRLAMQNRIALARHVDIGVAHWRASTELDWLDWVLAKLGGSLIPKAMHVEAIVWAAIAMRQGGGYLDSRYWKCWRRSYLKRIITKCGVDGSRLLDVEPWRTIKCFHAGGEAKWWLAELAQRGIPGRPTIHAGSGVVTPFLNLTPDRYEREQKCKTWLRRLDYYELLR